MENIIKNKILFFIYTIFICLIFKLTPFSESYRQLLPQILVLIFALPYMICIRREYFKINYDIINKIIMLFFIILGITLFKSIILDNIIVVNNSIGLINIIICILLAPIIEEIYFRVILQDFFNNFLSNNYSAILCSILFGLAHTNYYTEPLSVILVMCLGYILTKVLKEYKSIYIIIAFHAILNYTTLFLKFV